MIFEKKLWWLNLLLVLLPILSVNPAQVVGQSMHPSGNWELSWEENFDQEEFDASVWSKIPRGRPDWQNLMSDFDSCYAMKEGNLVLRGIVNKPEYGLQDTARFLTGGLYTKGKQTFHKGRLEIRAKLTGARGAWPAIWLLPDDGNWPHGGEIDIMERLNDESIAYQTVHSYYTVELGETYPPKGSTGPIDPNGYNVYAVELGPDSLRFYINDRHTFTYPKIATDKPGQYPFDRAFYLLIDMQLGGSWVGRVNPAELPVEMWVDWVRFYTSRK